jgi:hypothetical protein
LLLATAVGVPTIIVSILCYPMIFAPAAIFLLLNLYFWYSRLTTGDQQMRIDLTGQSKLSRCTTWTAIVICSIAGLLVYAIAGVPF